MKNSLRGRSFGLDRFSGLYLLGLFILVFGLWIPQYFLTIGTVRGIASQQSIVAILAIAVLIPLAAGAYDLSVGAVANLSTVIVSVLQTSFGFNMWAAILVALVTGSVIGLVNGFFVVRLQVSSFITTLGMSSILIAVVTIVTGGINPFPPSTPGWTALTQTPVFGFQTVLIFAIVIAVLAWWWLEHTPSGRYIYATGANAEAARLTGIKTGKWTWISLVISGSLAGLVGVLYASLYGPSLTYGQALLLPAFAAAFLGSTQVKPSVFNIWGTLIAIVVLATGIKGLQLLTGVQWLPDMFNGVALLGAVSFALWRQRAALRAARAAPAETTTVMAEELTPSAAERGRDT